MTASLTEARAIGYVARRVQDAIRVHTQDARRALLCFALHSRGLRSLLPRITLQRAGSALNCAGRSGHPSRYAQPDIKGRVGRPMHFRPSVNHAFTNKNRHSMTSRLVAALVAAALSCTALPAAYARTYVAPTASFGTGAYVHRFVLRDPVTHRPLPNARYRLLLPGQVIAGLPPHEKGGESVVFGTTDAAGRTVRIRLPARHPEHEWALQPIVGEGDMGGTFRVIDIDTGRPYGHYSYVLDVTGAYLACGQIDANGYTVFAQSHEDRKLWLHPTVLRIPTDTDWCAGPAADIANSAGNPGVPDLYTQYLGSLVADGQHLGRALRQQIAAKMVALAIAERDEGRIDTALEVGNFTDRMLNTVGYDLVNAGLKIDRAMAMIDARLAKSPDDAYALDSKGWALYRLGRNDDALTWFDRSIAIFAKDGDIDKDAREAYASGLTHKGEVLWKLARRDEAREAFAQARQVQPENADLAETLKRLAIPLGQDGAKAPGTASE
ncbi:tetratricopeptide repeat protein [Burkholderia contaminans]|uniref:tetratricopeptide repeat protein n=1 Tax=Burkholderia contaminans TaxID=488447 RepID=UPI0020C63778|nr:tetratricopeptide repeat protein [Burkholderia contaminans]